MATSYELVFVRSIPFWHADGALYFYDPESVTTGTGPTGSEPVRLGSYDKATGRSELAGDDELRARIEPALAEWRATLRPTERGKPIPPAAKPSRARRPAAKSTKASRTKST
jgi:hypothetical protein